MPLLSPVMVTLRQPYAPRFQARTWAKAQQLLIGTVLAPGQRTVSMRWDCMKKAQFCGVPPGAPPDPLVLARGRPGAAGATAPAPGTSPGP